MAITFKFYHDSALTQEVTALNPIAATQTDTGSLAATDVQLWFGSTASGTAVQATSDPGVDDIEISITDSDGSGTGEAAANIKLATSQAGLAAATGGAALAIGTSVSSGVGNAFSFWARLDPQQTTVGTYTDMALETNSLTEA